MVASWPAATNPTPTSPEATRRASHSQHQTPLVAPKDPTSFFDDEGGSRSRASFASASCLGDEGGRGRPGRGGEGGASASAAARAASSAASTAASTARAGASSSSFMSSSGSLAKQSIKARSSRPRLVDVSSMPTSRSAPGSRKRSVSSELRLRTA